MTPKEQRTFIAELCDNIKESLLRRQFPAEWDGHELRVLLAQRFEQSAQMSAIRREPRSRRARNFKNACLVANY